jgi:hypothetical protein
MIPYEHGRLVYEKFPGKKKLVLFDGTHNSDRPSQVNSEVFDFIR